MQSMPEIITVIITCYNHARYLSDAIESVLSQSYKFIELIVVDDGSTDNTREVAQRYASVKYVYQQNQGLSAARNTGIDHSTGNYIVFLDADDWFLPEALQSNYGYLSEKKELAFVSGSFETAYFNHAWSQTSGRLKLDNENRYVVIADKTPVKSNHYQHFLTGNYVIMHAAVLYRRWVFDEFKYDTTLKACEDYDLYLKVSRKYPVSDHSALIAAYRFHNANMSYNSVLMLDAALSVLKRQLPFLENEVERSCYEKGVKLWKLIYAKQVYRNYTKKGLHRTAPNKGELSVLRKNAKDLYFKYLIKTRLMAFKNFVKKVTPGFVLRGLFKAGAFTTYTPLPGKVAMGDLGRTTPFSKVFGYDRGGPIDRYYIENFLEKNATSIYGRVLEIGDNEYTMRFGGAKVAQSDILHIDASNAKATFVGDLSNAPQIPENSFDCIVLTQTLQFIYDYRQAIKTCYRILKPGGKLLLTVPGISQIDHDDWKDIWLWSFTDTAIKKVLAEAFSVERISVETFGNVLTASAFLYGMGVGELKRQSLDEIDPHYQVLITAIAMK